MKIFIISNNNDLNQNIKLIENIKNKFGKTTDYISDNFIYIEPQNKFLKSTYEIHLLALDKKVLVNVDSPGTNQKGIISGGMGRRKRNQIINHIENTVI